MQSHVASSSLAVLIVGSAACGQCAEWVQRVVPGPSPRLTVGAYDALRQRTVVFGGEDSLGDTWEWDGSTWSSFAASGPSPRGAFGFAFDPAGAACVLFGGVNGTAGVHYSDTWEWNGVEWSLAASSGPPAPRRQLSMAFDGARGEMLLFGGVGPSFIYGDTWARSAAQWSQVSSGGPSARVGAAMAFDSNRSRVVLFGGQTTFSGTTSGQTWEWNGTQWSLAASAGPSPRVSAAMVFDSVRNRCVLFGGTPGGPGLTYLGDTWEWDGQSWTQLAVAGPSARYSPAMVFDTARNRVVLFGGRTDGNIASGETWELVWAGLPAFGQHPVAQTVYNGVQAVFSASVTSPGPHSFQWRRNGVELTDGGRFAGVKTETLTINYVEFGDAGAYDIVATNGCGSVASDVAALTVACYANCDESWVVPVLNVADFSCFLAKFAAGDGYANCDSSTAAPVLNVADFACFLVKFAAGCP